MEATVLLITIYVILLSDFVIMKTKKRTLYTSRLILKNLGYEDFDELLSMVKDPFINRTYLVQVPSTPEEEKNLLERFIKICESDKHYAYGIYFDKKLIGLINSVAIENNKIEMGYFINSKLWNQGFASEALSSVIEELFRIGFDTIVCAHFEDNPASGRVMQKCGMTASGYTEQYVAKDGEHKLIYCEIRKK